eukprot:tig00020704_g13172.t1
MRSYKTSSSSRRWEPRGPSPMHSPAMNSAGEAPAAGPGKAPAAGPGKAPAMYMCPCSDAERAAPAGRFHAFTYDYSGTIPILKGSFRTYDDAKAAADKSGAYSAIVTSRGMGVIYMNKAAWAWGGIDKARNLIKDPLTVRPPPRGLQLQCTAAAPSCSAAAG